MSDNGSAPGGGPGGTSLAGQSLERILERLDEIGGPTSVPAIPWGWSQAGNTPLKWYKQNTFGGGIRDPLIVHWPGRVRDPGAIRPQFHHVSDVTPTLLELLEIDAPDTYAGYNQMPITGTSFAYTLDDGAAPTQKPQQYFELAGDRGIWRDGWKAVTHHVRGAPYADDRLYHLDEDFAESRDLAAEKPELLRELIDLWWVEAGRNGVLPMDDRRVFGPTGVIPVAPRHDLAAQRPDAIQAGRLFRYLPPISQIPSQAAAPMGSSQWTVRADIERKSEADEGVLLARGRGFGLAIWVQGQPPALPVRRRGDHVGSASPRTYHRGRSAAGHEGRSAGAGSR